MNLCCACGTYSSSLVRTSTPLQNTVELTIGDVLNEIAGYQLVDESKKDLIEYICLSCIKRAKDAQEFKQMILKSHQHYLNATTTCVIKTEIKEEQELANELNEICDMIDNEDIQLIRDFQTKNAQLAESKPDVERKQYNTRKKKINFKCLINSNSKQASNRVVRSESPLIQDNPAPFKCYKCKLILSTKGNLKTHMFTHSEELPFQCSYCPKRFRLNQTLKIHTLIHTKEFPIKCKFCSKAFRQQSNYDFHFKRWHKKY